MRSHGWSMRARVIALLVATLLPLAALSGYWLLWEAQAERADARRAARDIAERIAGRAGYRVAAVHEMLEIFEHLPAIREGNGLEAGRLFRARLRDSPHLENIGLVAADGSIVATAVPAPPGVRTSLSDGEWFQQVMESGRPATGGFQVSRVAGTPVVVLAHPVRDRSDRLTGVVSAALRLDTITHAVSAGQGKLETPYRWAVVDARRNVLVGSQGFAPVGQPLASLAGLLAAETEIPGTPWRVVAGIPEAVVAERVRQPFLLVGLPAAAILLLAAGCGIAIARGTWRPLQALTAAIRRIGAGEAEVPIPVVGGGEAGELAEAFRGTLGTLTRRQSELAALLRANQALASSLELEQILQRIVEQAAAISGTPTVRLFLVGEGESVLRCRVGVGFPTEVGRELVIPVGESFSGRVAATGEPLAVADCRGDARVRYPEHTQAYGLVSYLGLPVKVQAQLYGVLVFNTPAPRTYTPDEIAYLGAFAQQAALAIRNTQLHETALQRAAQLEMLTSLTQPMMATLDLQEMARELLAAVQALIPGAAARLWQVGGAEEDNPLDLVASVGVREPRGGQYLRFRPNEGLAGLAYSTRQPVISRDIRQDTRFVNREWAATEGFASGVVLPLLRADHIYGILAIFTRDAHDFSPPEVSLLRRLADHAAIAIENARLHAAALRRGEELDALVRAGHSIMGRLDLQETLDRILEEAAQITGSSDVKVLLMDQRAGVLRIGAVRGTATPMGYDLPVGVGLSGLVAATGQPVFSADSPNDPRNLFAARDRELGLVTYLGLPIKLRDEVVGVLTFNTQAAKHYTPEELAYLTAFADQAAIAMQNARLYDEIRRQAAELEVRVRERTAELEEALRVKAEFLAKMSHELRTPLNFIVGFTGLLKEGSGGPLTPKQKQFVDRIHTGGQHLVALVSDLMDLSLMEAGQAQLQLEKVPLAPLVQEIRDLFGVQVAQRKLTLGAALSPDLLVVADRRKLAQVLANLVNNAVKFTPDKGRITVTARKIDGSNSQGVDPGQPRDQVTSQPSDGTGEFLELAVEDTGIGLAAGDLERIFRGFEQVDPSPTRPRGGAGIGLALVRTLVELHGGRVWAESGGLGQGARFVVRLPRLQAAEPKRILVVEDNPSVLKPLTLFLQEAGFAVTGVRTGGEALAVIAARPMELVILDLGLPDLDGWEVLKRVRTTVTTRNLPVLVLTGMGADQADQAIALGANEFLTKPISFGALAGLVKDLLAGKASHPAQPPGEKR